MSSFSTEPITVGYWGIRGLAAPLRMMVMYRDVPLIAENYDCTDKDGGYDTSAWFSVKDKYKAKNALMNLPYVVHGDLVVTQSNACIHFVGRKLGFMGKNEVELVEIEQLLCEYMDIRNKVVVFAYGRSDSPGLLWVQSVVSQNSTIDKLHLWLQRKYPNPVQGPIYFVGDDATAADFALWEILDQVQCMAKYYKADDVFSQYPLIDQFLREFAALPTNQRYLTSKLAALPINNLMAKFGATPSGDAFVAGADKPWHGSSGTY